MEEEKPIVWRTTYNRSMSPSEMSHRHLSNILWYFEIFWEGKAKPHFSIQAEIDKRFGGIRLPYQPLLIFKEEIEALIKFGYSDGKIGSDVIVKGVCIGKVTEENTNTEVFTDVAGWKAISIVENKNGGPFWIYDDKGQHVAFLSHEGHLDILPKIFKLGTSKVDSIKFDPKTELKQAMRYVYLTLQRPDYSRLSE